MNKTAKYKINVCIYKLEYYSMSVILFSNNFNFIFPSECEPVS